MLMFFYFIFDRDLKIERNRRDREEQLLAECTFTPSYTNLASANPQDILDEMDRSIVAASSTSTVKAMRGHSRANDSSDEDLSPEVVIPSIGARRREAPMSTRTPKEPSTPPHMHDERIANANISSSRQSFASRSNYLYNTSDSMDNVDNYESPKLRGGHSHEPEYPLPPPEDMESDQDEDGNVGFGYDSMQSARASIQKHPALFMRNTDDEIEYYDGDGGQWQDEEYPLPPPESGLEDSPPDNSGAVELSSSSPRSHHNTDSYSYSNKDRGLISDTDDLDTMSLLEQLASSDFTDHSDNYSSAYELEDVAYQQQRKLRQQEEDAYWQQQQQLQQQLQQHQEDHPQAWISQPPSSPPRHQWPRQHSDDVVTDMDEYETSTYQNGSPSPPSPAPPQRTPIVLKKREKSSSTSMQSGGAGKGSTRRRPPPTPVAAGLSGQNSRSPSSNTGIGGSKTRGKSSYNIDIL